MTVEHNSHWDNWIQHHYPDWKTNENSRLRAIYEWKIELEIINLMETEKCSRQEAEERVVSREAE